MTDPSTIQPLHDRVLIREIPAVHPQGLFVVRTDPRSVDAVSDGTANHDDYRRVPVTGIILAIGPGKWNTKEGYFKPTTARVGQIVTFSNWNDWEEAPESYFMVQEADIWFIHEKKQAIQTAKSPTGKYRRVSMHVQRPRTRRAEPALQSAR